MTDIRSFEEIVGDAYDAVPLEYNGIPLDDAIRQMAEELKSLRELRDGLKDELEVRRAEAAHVTEILGRRYVGWTTPDIIQALLSSQDSSKEITDYYADALAALPQDMRHLTLREAVEQLVKSAKPKPSSRRDNMSNAIDIAKLIAEHEEHIRTELQNPTSVWRAKTLMSRNNLIQVLERLQKSIPTPADQVHAVYGSRPMRCALALYGNLLDSVCFDDHASVGKILRELVQQVKMDDDEKEIFRAVADILSPPSIDYLIQGKTSKGWETCRILPILVNETVDPSAILERHSNYLASHLAIRLVGTGDQVLAILNHPSIVMGIDWAPEGSESRSIIDRKGESDGDTEIHYEGR